MHVQFCSLGASFFGNGRTSFLIGQLHEVVFLIIQVDSDWNLLYQTMKYHNICRRKTYGKVSLLCRFVASPGDISDTFFLKKSATIPSSLESHTVATVLVST